MLLPSKITNYNKSVISKFVPVLKELTKKDKSPLALYKSTKSHFSSVNEFVETLDCLYLKYLFHNKIYVYGSLDASLYINHNEKLGVCLDTCHIFSAGYDIVNDLDGVLAEFDSIIGLDRLKAIHLNDSMMPFGGKKDRHAVIGEGEIGLNAIINFMSHPKLNKLPFFLETPLEDEGHKKEIAMIKEILSDK